MQSVDTIIYTDWLIPIEPHDTCLEKHAVAVHQGCIVAVLPHHDMQARYQSDNVITLDNHVLLPGLVNAHTHSPMTLFRGLADDLPLMDWLNNYIWPAEKKWLSESFIADGTELAMAEMLRGGTTCFNEHYFYADTIASCVHKVGMRANIGVTIIDFPTSWSASSDDCIDKALSMRDTFSGYPLVNLCLAPHAPYTVNEDAFKRIKAIAEEHDLNIHIHMHETKDEVEQSLDQYGQRPLRRLAELGLLTHKWQNVHMTQVNEDDVALLQTSGAGVITCPESNLKLASGFCPVQTLLDAGITVALGTDGAASNNDLDMFTEMRTLALLAKGVTRDLTAIEAATALRVATLNGAKILGLDDKIGTVEIGKAADLIAVDLSDLTAQPVYNPISQLVYAVNSRQVNYVWVNGQCLLEKGKLTTLDVSAIQHRTKAWQKRIARETSSH